MENPAGARAYARADFAAVNQGFVDRFRARFPEYVGGRAVDLGCGPADIPVRLGRALPGLQVTAVDGSAAMLAEARRAIAAAGAAPRIALVRARLPPLPFPPRAFDAILSNSLLHHLPDPLPFWHEVERLARPGAPLLVMDLARPASPAAARALVELHAAVEDPILREDFYRSLLAAFTPEEVRRQLATLSLRLECALVSDRHWVVSGRR